MHAANVTEVSPNAPQKVDVPAPTIGLSDAPHLHPTQGNAVIQLFQMTVLNQRQQAPVGSITRSGGHPPLTKEPGMLYVLHVGLGGTISGHADDPERPDSYNTGKATGEKIREGIPLPSNVVIHHYETKEPYNSKDTDTSKLRDIDEILDTHLAWRTVDGESYFDVVLVTGGSDGVQRLANWVNWTRFLELPHVMAVAMKCNSVAGRPDWKSDAKPNLAGAYALAATAVGTPSLRKTVMVTTNFEIHAAPFFAKRDTTNVNAIQTVNAPRVGTFTEYSSSPSEVAIESKPAVPVFRFDSGKGELPRVDTVVALVGQPLSTITQIRGCFATKDDYGREAIGLVIAGSGNGEFHRLVEDEIEKWTQAGKIIIRASTAGNGEVSRNGAFKDDVRGTICAGKLVYPMAAFLMELIAQQAEIVAREMEVPLTEPMLKAVTQWCFRHYQSEQYWPTKEVLASLERLS